MLSGPLSAVELLQGLLLGACLGSFANVCIHRIPRGKSVVRPRSRCPRCHASISWFQNIPVLSYAALRGRCAGCRRPIAPRYVWVELLLAGLVGIVFVRAPGGVEQAFGVVLAFVLVVISFIDLDWRIIPDVFSLGLLGVALVASPLNTLLGDTGAQRALGAGIGAGTGFWSAWALSYIGRRVFRREALGGGDVKLLAGFGALLGWQGVVTAWFVGSLVGSLVFVVLKLRRQMDWGAYLPFGPFLAVGAWVHWMWPRWFGAWWGF